METIDDIITEMRERAEAMEIHGTPHGIKIAVKEFANRIEKAHEFELSVERSKAAGEGYAAGKLSATRRIVLDCSDPQKGCDCCVLHRDYGCAAPRDLDDCWRYHGVWVITNDDKEVKDDSCGQRG